MPRQARTSDEDLFLLCDDIQELEGGVTPARLREAAGGGGYNRLKAIVEAWRVRRVEAAKRTGIEAREIEARERRNVSMIMRQALVQFRLGGSGLF